MNKTLYTESIKKKKEIWYGGKKNTVGMVQNRLV